MYRRTLAVVALALALVLGPAAAANAGYTVGPGGGWTFDGFSSGTWGSTSGTFLITRPMNPGNPIYTTAWDGGGNVCYSSSANWSSGVAAGQYPVAFTNCNVGGIQRVEVKHGTTVRFDYTGTLATSAASTCSAFLVTPQAAFISGTLSLRFKASSVPSGGWKVYGTSSNNTVAGTSLIYTVPTTQLDGFPGWYGFDSTTAATPLTYLRVERATNSGCWQTVATSTTTPVTIDAPNLGADEDGANCGTLNVFCQLKAALSWAFIPSETAVDDAQATFEGLADKVPWGYATAAYEFTDKVLERAETGCDTSPTAQASCALRFGISDNEFGLAPTNDLDVVVLADGSPGGELMDSLRPIVGAGVWFVLLGGLAFWLFRKLAPGGGDS